MTGSCRAVRTEKKRLIALVARLAPLSYGQSRLVSELKPDILVTDLIMPGLNGLERRGRLG
jgi:CheY-like chemotaxis protein